jgi:hypothetical protein
VLTLRQERDLYTALTLLYFIQKKKNYIQYITSKSLQNAVSHAVSVKMKDEITLTTKGSNTPSAKAQKRLSMADLAEAPYPIFVANVADEDSYDNEILAFTAGRVGVKPSGKKGNRYSVAF